MKNYLCLFLVLVILLTGCTPKAKLNDDNILIVKRTIVAVDKYLDGESDAKDTRDIVDIQEQSVKKEEDPELNLELGIKFTVLSSSLLVDKPSDVKEARNDLAKLAGLESYK